MAGDAREQRQRHVVGFAVVGGIGFAVDAGVLVLLAQQLALNVYVARLISFVVATLATWLLNRTFVFRAPPMREKHREYARYLFVQSGGALINLGVFSALIALVPDLRNTPVLPLAAGSAVAMVFNFSGSRWWVFPAHPR